MKHIWCNALLCIVPIGAQQSSVKFEPIDFQVAMDERVAPELRENKAEGALQLFFQAKPSVRIPLTFKRVEDKILKEKYLVANQRVWIADSLFRLATPVRVDISATYMPVKRMNSNAFDLEQPKTDIMPTYVLRSGVDCINIGLIREISRRDFCFRLEWLDKEREMKPAKEDAIIHPNGRLEIVKTGESRAQKLVKSEKEAQKKKATKKTTTKKKKVIF